MTAARPKPQVTGPDEFSAPTPTHAPTSTSTTFAEHPNAFPAPTSSSPASTTSFTATAPGSSAPRRTRRSRTPTPNDRSGPSAANSATGPSSGTSASSNSSSTTTSSITTRIDRTAASVNARPTIAKLSRIGPASRSDDTPPATDSSTSTAKQPEHSDNGQPHTGYPNFSEPTPPTRLTTHAANALHRGRTSIRHPHDRERSTSAALYGLPDRLLRRAYALHSPARLTGSQRFKPIAAG